MDRQTATMALQFMQRMSVQGAEVGAFIAVRDALMAIASGAVVVLPAEGEQAATVQPLRTAMT